MRVTGVAVFLLAGVTMFLPARSAGESGSDWKDLSPERKEMALIEQLSTMSLTTNVAMLLRKGRTDQALRLLEERLESSLDSADELIQAGARLPTVPALPSLREAPVRAHKYATEYGLSDAANRAALLAGELR